MIYVTGDSHGDYFKFSEIEEKTILTQYDYVLICGDFGFIFSNSPLEKRLLDELAKKEYTILFIALIYIALAR